MKPVLKKLFGKGDDPDDGGYSIDDLMVLERYEEAATRLKKRIHRRDDLHDHLRLANCYVGMRSLQKAIGQFVHVAEQYAADGFFERGIAVLTKARRLDPDNETVVQLMSTLDSKRRLEQSRKRAMEGFVQGQKATGAGGAEDGTLRIEFESLWDGLEACTLVEELEGDELTALFRGVELSHREPGTVLAERGGRDERLYVIASGTVIASAEGKRGEWVQVRTFGNGQIIGDGVLLEHRPWPARYVVTTHASLLSIDTDGLARCLHGQPDPKRFLDVLRGDRSDHTVAQLVAEVEREGD